MDVILIGAALPFGPESLRFRSLGGSEIAQLMAAKALASQGHRVFQVTPLPQRGEPDHISSGTLANDGVTYLDVENGRRLICETAHDLLIISRDLRFAGMPHRARHAVLWVHDIGMRGYMDPASEEAGLNIDEVWAVSHWHADQIAAATGYPRARIFATRNGIVDIRDLAPDFRPPTRRERTLLFAARPERGVQTLLRPGGIMERLPEFNLEVCMYAHFPEHMAPLYQWMSDRFASMPNASFVGSLTQEQTRALIASAAAYVYPTEFQETSCLLARECIEQRTPFLTTSVGALPETLGESGVFLETFLRTRAAGASAPQWDSDAFCAAFADMVRWFFSDQAKATRSAVQRAMEQRKDLYWDGVVSGWPARVGRYETRSLFTRAWSLARSGDDEAALATLRNTEAPLGPAARQLRDRIADRAAVQSSEMGVSLARAAKHRARQTLTVILNVGNREQTLRAALDSIAEEAACVIALADETTSSGCKDIVDAWARGHPDIYVEHRAAERDWDRNREPTGLETDWWMAMDGDQYLTKDLKPLLRSNARDYHYIDPGLTLGTLSQRPYAGVVRRVDAQRLDK